MKHTLRILMGSAAATAFITALTAVPASAQGAYGGGGGAAAAAAPSGGGGGAAVASAPSGGSSSGGSSGGSSSGGGAWGGGSSGGGSVARESGAGRYAGPTGGSGSAGYSAPHSGRTSNSGSSHNPAANGANGSSGERGSGRSAASGRTGNTPGANDNVPTYSRPRDGNGNTAVGTAVPRGTTPAPPGGGTIWIPGGYYPGYYPGYGYGYYDPFGYYSGFGFYGGGYYDPWYGGYPADTQVAYSAPSDEGSLRLKIKPREAEVYVDGYFVGVVNDFDGMFQRLHLDSGPHRIEVRAPGYETLDIDVRITADHTTTYEGALKKIQ